MLSNFQTFTNFQTFNLAGFQHLRPCTQEHPHVIVPSALMPNAVTAPYSLTICSAHEVTLFEFPATQASVLSGQWSTEGGGCNLHPTW